MSDAYDQIARYVEEARAKAKPTPYEEASVTLKPYGVAIPLTEDIAAQLDSPAMREASAILDAAAAEVAATGMSVLRQFEDGAEKIAREAFLSNGYEDRGCNCPACTAMRTALRHEKDGK